MGNHAAARFVVVAAVVAAIVAGGSVGCVPDPPPVFVPPEPTGCTSDDNCPLRSICDKEADDDGIVPADDARGVCVPIEGCRNDDDCIDGYVCRNGLGSSGPGTCEPEVSSCDPVNDEQSCSGGVCLVSSGRGQCVESEPLPARCQVILQRSVALDGDLVDVGVYAFDADGGLVSATQPPPVTATCAFGRCAQQVAVPPAQGVACAPATLQVLAPLAGGQRVVVVDDAGLLLVDVPVRIVKDGVVSDGLTDGSGVAVFDVAAVDAISILPIDHEQHTLLAPPSDLIVVTRRESRLVTGAVVTTDYGNVHTVGDLKLAVAGLPLSTDLGRFSLDALFGPSSDVVVDIAGITEGPQVAPLPRGVTVGLGDTLFRGDAVVAGLPPAGGQLFVWSLAGQLRLSEVGPLFTDRGTFDRELALDLLSGPSGSQADHGVATRAAPPAVPITEADDDDDNGFADAAPAVALPTLSVVPDTLLFLDAPLAPPAPQQLTLVVVDVPGAGLLPLGLQERRAADGRNDAAGDFVDHAPPHDGLEGFAVKTLVIAYDARPWRDSDPLRARFGPDEAPSSTARIAGDAVTLAAPPAGVDVVHLRLTSSSGRRWHLWSASADLTDDPTVDPSADLSVDLGVVAPAFASATNVAGDVTAVLESIVLRDGASLSLTDNGALADVEAVTRVACVEGACGP